jgi:hypothetical protein
LGYRVVCLHDHVDKSNLCPTYRNVVEQLKAICQNPMIGPDDLLLVHFACHGTLVERQPYLVMHDTGYESMTQTALPVAEVEAEMRNSGATRLVLTLDACHAGVELREPVRDAVDRDPGTPEPAYRKIDYEPGFIQRVYDSAQGFVLIAASAAQQTALELNGKQHGLFTYFMLEGLSRKADRAERGFVTVNDLIEHVTDTVEKLTGEDKQVQQPTYRIDGKGNMILADYRELDSIPSPSDESSVSPIEIALELLRKLSPSQFNLVIFQYGADQSLLPLEKPQAEQAMALIGYAAQEDPRLKRLLEIVNKVAPHMKR